MRTQAAARARGRAAVRLLRGRSKAQAGQPSRQSTRTRVGALTPRQSAALTDSSERAVYCVPKYSLGAVTPWATVQSAVDRHAAIGIYATTMDGEVELDLVPEIMSLHGRSMARARRNARRCSPADVGGGEGSTRREVRRVRMRWLEPQGP